MITLLALGCELFLQRRQKTRPTKGSHSASITNKVPAESHEEVFLRWIEYIHKSNKVKVIFFRYAKDEWAQVVVQVPIGGHRQRGKLADFRRSL